MYPILSVRQLVSLADRNCLSLVLRYQWSNTADPYNGLRAIIRQKVLLFCIVILGLVTVVIFSAAIFSPFTSLLGGLMGGLLSGVGLITFIMLAIFLQEYSRKTESARFAAEVFQRDFCELLSYFAFGNTGAVETAKEIAHLDPDQLKVRAVKVLVDEALVIERYKQTKPDVDYDPTYSADVAAADKRFDAKKRCFEFRFALTHGHDYFFKEARNLLAEEMKKTEQTASSEPIATQEPVAQ